jgi:hypothetical protein
MFTIRFERFSWRTALQVLALGASLVALQPVAAAEKLGAADKRAIEQTIRRQLDAFLRDDADGAFGFATPDIRRMFGSSDQFMEMVRDHYEPVYRPSGVRFVGIDSVDGEWVGTVQIVDGDGKVWRALFTVKRQPDKSWKIGGCQLVQTSAIAT